MRASVVILALALSACAARRPVFVAPQWGNAPPPLPSEVAVIELERMSCPSSGPCQYQRITFRRDGVARQVFRTGKQVDSTLNGILGSAEFAALADSLVRTGFFRGGDDDEARHEDFTSQGVLVSAGTLCRSMVHGIDGTTVSASLPAIGLIDAAVKQADWTRCCRA